MLRTPWQELSAVTRSGLALALIGVVTDVVHHLFTDGLRVAEVLHVGALGHVLTLAGMVLALCGVVQAAVESRRRTRQKGGNDAARSSTTAAR